MEIGIKERVIEWAQNGGDFRAGLSLFLSYNRNIYYGANIEAKGQIRGLNTLISEFSNKTKMPVKDILREITNYTNWNELHEGEKGRLNDNTIARGGEGAKGRTGEAATVSQSEGDMERRRDEKKIIKLREEFPFLGRKDCPDVLALLVNKMLTAYDEYRDLRGDLFSVDGNDLDKCYQTSRSIVDAYILNREIWEELNYYKLHGKILGAMAHFKVKRIDQKYREMGTVDLVKIVSNNIPRKMSYYKKLLADKTTKNMDEIRQKAIEAEEEMAVIKGILKERGEL